MLSTLRSFLIGIALVTTGIANSRGQEKAKLIQSGREAPEGTPQGVFDKLDTSRQLNLRARSSMKNNRGSEAVQFAAQAVNAANDAFAAVDAKWSLALAYMQLQDLSESIAAYRTIIYRPDGSLWGGIGGPDLMIYSEYLLAILKARNWTESVFIFDKISHGVVAGPDFGARENFPVRRIKFSESNKEYSHMGAVANLLFAISCRSFQNTKDHTTIRKLKYDHIQEAISLSPRLWLAHYCLGDWYEGSQKWLDAKAEFERAVKLQPDAAAAHYHLGAVLDILHNKDLALKQFELAVKFSRHDDSDEI